MFGAVGFAIHDPGQRAEGIESEISDTIAQFDAHDPSLNGTVRVGAPDGYGSYVITPALARVQAAAPGIRIELVCFNISRREVDVLLVTDPPTAGRYRIRKLRSAKLSLYASRGYLARHGTPLSRADLADHTLIGYDPNSEYAHVAVRRMAQMNIAMRPGLVCSTVFAQLHAAIAGAGLAFLPTYVIEPSQALVQILPDEMHFEIDLWLMVHADIAQRARVRAVADAIFSASERHQIAHPK